MECVFHRVVGFFDSSRYGVKLTPLRMTMEAKHTSYFTVTSVTLISGY